MGDCLNRRLRGRKSLVPNLWASHNPAGQDAPPTIVGRVRISIALLVQSLDPNLQTTGSRISHDSN